MTPEQSPTPPPASGSTDIATEPRDRQPYEKPEIEHVGKLRELTRFSFD